MAKRKDLVKVYTHKQMVLAQEEFFYRGVAEGRTQIVLQLRNLLRISDEMDAGE